VIRRTIVLSILALTSAREMRAQVGYDPTRSPYRDLRETMEVTLYSGWFSARRDPAAVAPQSGPIVGVHYQWRASGPVNLTGDIARVESERRVLDPEKVSTCAAGKDCKLIGTFRWPLYSADAGLSMDLTGARSFYRLIPTARLGMGLLSDFHSASDVGQFTFGTRFAFSWGLGLRWLPGERYQVRADLLNRFYSVNYPETYYAPADDASVIFTNRQSKSAWLNNPSFTIGLSYLFSR
jgi:hypothetical protein